MGTMRPEDVEIRVDGITHCYSGSFKAVDNVGFTLGGGCITGLLGANGAGKSTLMNIICGVLTPTAGDVTINGHSIRTAPVAAKTRIGFLPQKPPLLMDLTVEEYLRYAASLRLVPNVRRAVDEVLDKCGIMHFRKRLIKHLSGGYQQRVGIAQALIHKPAFVVLDEPTNGLDPMQIIEIRHLVHDISENCLVMLSTHILHEVQMTCGRILMMSSGKLVFNGDIDTFNHSLRPDSLLVSMGAMPSEETLLALDGVKSVEAAHEHPGFTRLVIDADPDLMCEKLIAVSAGQGWHIREILKEMPSADDIFKYLNKSTMAENADAGQGSHGSADLKKEVAE